MIVPVMVALVLIKLWLVSGQVMAAVPAAYYDDGLYLNLAQHLVDGGWLGPYDIFTLLKPPGYPLWIAANFFVGLPLHISEQLVYAGACALFVRAIRPSAPSRTMRLVVFAVLLYQPMSFSNSTVRYIRESLYTTQVLCVTSCAVALMLRTGAPVRVLAWWSLALGLALGYLWITRDEGVVLLPALALAAAFIGVGLWRRSPDWRRLAAVGVAVPIAAAGVLAVSALNYRYYGLFDVSEFRSPGLSAAMGALARVEPAQYRRWVIVATETRSRIYPHSPAFRELETPFASRLALWRHGGPFLFERDQREMQEELATGTVLGTTCQEQADWDDDAMLGEIATGFFVLALREAADMAGRHTTPSDAMAYFTQLAGEVNGACDAGGLACGPARSSLAPPWRWDDLGLVLRRACRGTARLLALKDTPAAASIDREDRVASIGMLTNDRLAPAGGAPAVSGPTALDRWRVARLADIHQLYAAMLPAAAIAATAAALLLAASYRPRPGWPLLCPTLVLLVAGGTRLALLAYMDATAFQGALDQRYLLPIYPLMFAAIQLLLLDGGRRLLHTALRPAQSWPQPGREA